MEIVHKTQRCPGKMQCVGAVCGDYCVAGDSLWKKDSVGVWRKTESASLPPPAGTNLHYPTHVFSRPTDPEEALRFCSFHHDGSLKFSIRTIAADGKTTLDVLDYQPLAVTALPPNFKGIRWVLVDQESLKMLDLEGRPIESHPLPAEFHQHLSHPKAELKQTRLRWVCDRPEERIDLFFLPHLRFRDLRDDSSSFRDKVWRTPFNLQLLSSTQAPPSWVPLDCSKCVAKDCWDKFHFPKTSPSHRIYSMRYWEGKAHPHQWDPASRSLEHLTSERTFGTSNFSPIADKIVKYKEYVVFPTMDNRKLWVSNPREIYYVPDQADQDVIYGFDSSYEIHRIQLKSSENEAELAAKEFARQVLRRLQSETQPAVRVEAFLAELSSLVGEPQISTFKRRKLQ